MGRGFLDLPAEIRDQSYHYLVLLEAAPVDDDAYKAIRSDRSPELVDGVYNPYFVSIKPQQSPDERKKWYSRETWTYTSGVLHARDPTIWLLNRQVRREAMDVYLRDHISVEVHGHLEHKYVWCPKEIGLRHFKNWWRSLDEDTTRRVRTLEMRDYVDIVYPLANGTIPDDRGPVDGETEGGSWPYPMCAFRFEIRDHGHTLTIYTPLKLVEMQRDRIQSYLDERASSRTAAGSLFDGQNLYELIDFLRTCDDGHFDISSAELDDEDVSVRFRMWGTFEEVKFLDQPPWFEMKKGWRHVAATARLPRSRLQQTQAQIFFTSPQLKIRSISTTINKTSLTFFTTPSEGLQHARITLDSVLIKNHDVDQMRHHVLARRAAQPNLRLRPRCNSHYSPYRGPTLKNSHNIAPPHIISAIAGLNKQIRQEVFPLLIANHLSIDVRGHDGTSHTHEFEHHVSGRWVNQHYFRPRYIPGSWVSKRCSHSGPNNAGLRLFESFVDNIVTAQLAQTIKRLLVCDYVELVSTSSMTPRRPSREKGSLYNIDGLGTCPTLWGTQIAFGPAFDIVTEDDGDKILLRTALPTLRDCTDPVVKFVERLAGCAAKEGRTLNGDDIVRVVNFMRTSQHQGFDASLHLCSLKEVVTVRWQMQGDSNDVDARTGKLTSTGFKYVAVEASVAR